MKNKSLLQCLESINNIFKYVLFGLGILVLANLVFLLMSVAKTNYSNLTFTIVLDIVYILICLAFSIGNRSSVSPHSSYFMIILSIFNCYSLFEYAFNIAPTLALLNAGNQWQILVITTYISFALIILYTLIVSNRYIILNQYRYVQNTDIVQATGKNFLKTYYETFKGLEFSIQNIFVYFIAYTSLMMFFNGFLMRSGKFDLTTIAVYAITFGLSIGLFILNFKYKGKNKFLLHVGYYGIIVISFIVLLALSGLINLSQTTLLITLIGGSVGLLISIIYTIIHLIENKKPKILY